MSEKNGNGWVKIAVGFLWAAVIGVLTFMGTTIQANDKTNTADHVNIRSEIEQKDKELRESIEKKLTKIQDNQHETDKKLERVLAKLEDIKKEVKD